MHTEFSIILCLLTIGIISPTSGESDEPIVVLIRPISYPESHVYIYWYNTQFEPGYTIALSVARSYLEEGTASEEFFHIDKPFGFERAEFNKLKREENIDKYCIYLPLIPWSSTTCQSKINWMYDRNDILGEFTIPKLVIPGTHQSAAYAAGSVATEVARRWAITQSRSIKEQLIDGIRFLDLRPVIEIVDGKPVYMLYHNFLKLISMELAAREINEFMDMSNDVVIVSFKEFPSGFQTDNDHRNFQKYLENVFEKHAHPASSWWTTLNSFWQSNKRLVLCYDHQISEKSSVIWPRIPQHWADAQEIPDLENYFEERYKDIQKWSDSSRWPHAAMAQLTHKGETITGDVVRKIILFFNNLSPFSDSPHDLRHWADSVAAHIVEWFTQKWSSKANIIAVDFYEGSGIIDLAIQMNMNRARMLSSGYSRRKFFLNY